MASCISYYADEHVPRAVVRGLRDRGVDVLTVGEAALLSATDQTHLEKAAADGRVLVTQDDDFLRLHALGHPHCGIVYAAQGASVGAMIRGLMLIYQVLEPEDMRQHIEFL